MSSCVCYLTCRLCTGTSWPQQNKKAHAEGEVSADKCSTSRWQRVMSVCLYLFFSWHISCIVYFKKKRKEKLLFPLQRLRKLFLLATSHSSVRGVCTGVSAGVVCKCAWSVRKYIDIYLYIYIMQIHQNSNTYSYLNFWLQLGSSLVWERRIPSQTLVGCFLARQRIGYLHQYLYISQWTHAKSLTVVIPIPQKDGDKECHRLYISSTTIHNTTTVTTLSLLTPPNHFSCGPVPAF